MAFRSKGQQWRKRNGNDDARYQIPDQGSIGHTKDQQSNKEQEKANAFSKKLHGRRNVPKCSGIYLGGRKVKGVVLPLPLPWQYFE